MEQRKILNQLLKLLTQHLQVKADYGQDYQKDRMLLRGLCNQALELDGIDLAFYRLQDELLQAETQAKGVVDVQSLPYVDNLTTWQGDITRLQADAIVNAGNDEFLGCFVPCHSCIDNIIMSAAGFQMRNELRAMKQQNDNLPLRVTAGYNLPAKYVFHVAGPQIRGAVTNQDRDDLAQCYRNSLNQAKAMNLHTIVFCCISTGLYAFPNDLACQIAVDTVQAWQKANHYDLKVVFNTFKDIDQELYGKRLSK